MKLHQFRYLIAVSECDLNVTAASRRLKTSQSNVSRQLQLLESELSLKLFERRGRAVVRITPPGKEILARAKIILGELGNIERASADFRHVDEGALSIGTTHTQARYVLPPIIHAFRQNYPKVRLQLHQGASEQISALMTRNQVDFAVVSGVEDKFQSLIRLPLYRWHRTVIVPRGHPLASAGALTLQRLAEYPIVTYEFSLSGPGSLTALFENAKLEFDIALTAHDSDVIKTYVRCGLGVGILATMAFDACSDSDLVALDASHIFKAHTTWIGFRRGTLMRAYMREFVRSLAPHIPAAVIEALDGTSNQREIDDLLTAIPTPVRSLVHD